MNAAKPLITNSKNYSTCPEINSQVFLTECEILTTQQVCSLLCSETKSGGAGLTIATVKPLFDAEFNGIHLLNIVNCIKVLGLAKALEFVHDDYDNVPKPTITSVAFWVNDQLLKPIQSPITIVLKEEFKQKEITTPEHLKSARTDPIYDYLRNLTNPSKLTNLEQLIGTNIELPQLGQLGENYVPKDFDPKLPFLLTRQRFEILKQVIERKEEGFVLSGPHGISKSYTMYLLAAYAIVNSIPLLYVPKSSKWVTE